MTEAAVSGYGKARDWIKENPGKAAVVSLSLIAGIRGGSALPGFGATILGAGAAGHWYFHSALPVVGMRKLTERYTAYLKDQESRLAKGEMMTRSLGIEFSQLRVFRRASCGHSQLGRRQDSHRSALRRNVTGFPVALMAESPAQGIWFFATASYHPERTIL